MGEMSDMANVYDFQSYKDDLEYGSYEEIKARAYSTGKGTIREAIDLLEPLYIACDESNEDIRNNAKLLIETIGYTTREFLICLCQYFEFDEKEIHETIHNAKSLKEIADRYGEK